MNRVCSPLNARPMALSRLYVRTFDERTALATLILTWLTIQLSSRENHRRQYKYHLDADDDDGDGKKKK